MRRLVPAIYTLFIVLFGLLGYFAHQYPGFPADNTISQPLQDINIPLFSRTMDFISTLGETVSIIIIIASLALILLVFRRRLEAIFIVASPAVGGLVNYLFKLLIDRPRPGDEILAGGLSFPSGHTTYAVILGGLLFFLAPRLLVRKGLALTVQVLSVLYIALTALSRIYLGAHYPSDILGSLLLGGLLLTPAIVLYKRRTRQITVEPEVQDARTA